MASIINSEEEFDALMTKLNNVEDIIQDAIRARLEEIYYVGKLIYDTANVNPATYLGFGTWQLWGAGRVAVGVDTTQTEFNTVEKTGGEKTHTLTTSEMPSHSHTMKAQITGSGTGPNITVPYAPGGAAPSLINYTGGGSAHNNLQPYITCYIWKRTA